MNILYELNFKSYIQFFIWIFLKEWKANTWIQKRFASKFQFNYLCSIKKNHLFNNTPSNLKFIRQQNTRQNNNEKQIERSEKMRKQETLIWWRRRDTKKKRMKKRYTITHVQVTIVITSKSCQGSGVFGVF